MSTAWMRMPGQTWPGAAVAMAGGVQLTSWKQRRLACCRDVAAEGTAPDARAPHRRWGGAWRYGLQLGLCCVQCCANLTIVLLVTGVMDAVPMTAVTAAVTIERLAPGARVSRSIGIVAVGVGLLLAAYGR